MDLTNDVMINTSNGRFNVTLSSTKCALEYYGDRGICLGDASYSYNDGIMTIDYAGNIITEGSVTAGSFVGDGSGLTGVGGGSMNYTNIAMTNQSQIFTKTNNFTAPMSIRSNVSSGYSATLDLYDEIGRAHV